MNIVIISGSTRPNSQSVKVAGVLQRKLVGKAEVELLDLAEHKLPLYDDGKHQSWADLSTRLQAADGCIWVVPEWNGSAGPGIMNFLAYLKQELNHKPVLLVGVSSGIGGAYPLAQLRAFGAKNSRAVFVPEALRFMHVKELFNGPEPDQENATDVTMHQRADYALTVLLAYATALQTVRNQVIDGPRYPTGY